MEDRNESGRGPHPAELVEVVFSGGGDEDWDDMSDEEYFARHKTIRAKWSMDGARTLEEAAQMLRVQAAGLESLAGQGWVLDEPVDDDYGHLSRP